MPQLPPPLINIVPEREKMRICIVSDFFVPNLGGVEMHMYNIG